MQLVITEKPSVAMSIADVIGADKRKDGYMEGNGYIVSWCIGHEEMFKCLSKDTQDKLMAKREYFAEKAEIRIN